MKSLVFRLIVIVLSILLTVNVILAVFPSSDKKHTSLTFDDLMNVIQYAPAIDLSWVDTYIAFDEPDSNGKFESSSSSDFWGWFARFFNANNTKVKIVDSGKFVSFVNTYLLAPIRFVCLIGTMFVNAFIYIGYFVVYVFT